MFNLCFKSIMILKTFYCPSGPFLTFLNLVLCPQRPLWLDRVNTFSWFLASVWFGLARILSSIEKGWHLGPFAAALPPGQTPAQAIKYKETIRD